VIDAPLSLLRLPKVIERVGLRKSAIYHLVKLGQFPQPIRLGLRCSAWSSHAVDEWVRARIAFAESRGVAK
jgi:prophage regulatory protein